MHGVILSIITLSALAAEPVQVRAILEAPETPFHRTARFVVEVEAPREFKVRIADLEGGFEGLGVRKEAFESLPLDDTHQLLRQSWTLDPEKIKLYRIPPVEVTWGEAEGATTPPMAFRVRGLTEAERTAAERFVDITTPPPLSTARDTVLRWGAGLGVAGLALAALLWVVLRKKVEPAAPPVKPWEVAEKRLAELGRRNLPEKGVYGQYYVDLSSILRYYLEDRFDLHAPDLTTPELLRAVVERKVLSDPHQEFLAQFLRHCDYVKFAQYKPSSVEMEGGFKTVRQFVCDTVPKPASETETEAA